MQNNTFFGYNNPSTLIVLEKISSTNDYAKELLSNFKPQLPFTAIMAKTQTEGRGQRGTNWSTAAHENLTISYIYTPEKMLPEEQFLITLISSLAIYDILEKYIPTDLSIKWPNDIMVRNKKLGGILIENKITSTAIKSSVIGIGINVFQTHFSAPLTQRATSIRLEDFDFNLTIIELAQCIQQRLTHYDMIFQEGKTELLWELYIDRLFRKNAPSQFKIGDKDIEGTIIGVDKSGHLIVEINQNISKFDLKDIKYIL